jgi:hypothetical protein
MPAARLALAASCTMALRHERRERSMTPSARSPAADSPDHRLAHLTLPEAVMRIGTLLLVIWLIIGAIAAGQRHYFTSSRPSCTKTSTVIVTIAAGPLNYAGVNPNVACTA